MTPNEDNLLHEDISDNQPSNSTHIDIIEAYLIAGGEGIILSGHQEGILDRLRFADEKIRQSQGRFKREAIANMIRMKYGVSRATAFTDIVHAERVFASSYPLNKQYEIGIQIENFKEQIRLASSEGDRKAVAMLGKVLVELYKQYPDVIKVNEKKTLIMNVVQQFFDSPEATAMSLDEAIQQAEIVEGYEDDQ